jgi:hypothetical protein
MGRENPLVRAALEKEMPRLADRDRNDEAMEVAQEIYRVKLCNDTAELLTWMIGPTMRAGRRPRGCA